MTSVLRETRTMREYVEQLALLHEKNRDGDAHGYRGPTHDGSTSGGFGRSSVTSSGVSDPNEAASDYEPDGETEPAVSFQEAPQHKPMSAAMRERDLR